MIQPGRRIRRAWTPAFRTIAAWAATSSGTAVPRPVSTRSVPWRCPLAVSRRTPDVEAPYKSQAV